jgi:2-C-methyl-D-erythritol 4-phosphate cytidylyltransferase
MDKKITAIILAAGKGTRMESKDKKQFMLLKGKPVLYYSLKTFEDSSVNDIILVTNEADISYCRKEIVDRYGFTKVKAVISGGNERYKSVYAGLKQAEGADYVLIHDSARPFVTNEMIESSISNVKLYKACTIAMPVKDTIKIADSNQMGVTTPDRRYVWQIQTPQTFDYSMLRNAYEKMLEQDDITVTDDTGIAELYGNTLAKLIEGSYKNIKITTPEDLDIAKIFMEKSMKNF